MKINKLNWCKRSGAEWAALHHHSIHTDCPLPSCQLRPACRCHCSSSLIRVSSVIFAKRKRKLILYMRFGNCQICLGNTLLRVQSFSWYWNAQQRMTFMWWSSSVWIVFCPVRLLWYTYAAQVSMELNMPVKWFYPMLQQSCFFFTNPRCQFNKDFQGFLFPFVSTWLCGWNIKWWLHFTKSINQ